MWDERFEGILRQRLPFLSADGSLDEDLSLRDFGLDSMGTVELLSTLERTYDVKFVGDSLSMENFATPGLLWTTISKLQ
jgi:acyl carrier protein